MLSGGAGFGKYHHGLILALNEQDLLPKIIVGSSAGSLIGAVLCTLQRSEIQNFNNFEYCYSRKIIGWNGNSLFDIFKNAVVKKPLGSIDTLKNFIRLQC